MAEVTTPGRDYFEVEEPLILISIGQFYRLGMEDTEIYETVRNWWPLSIPRANQYRLVLARYHGEVVGAYRPEGWQSCPESLGRQHPEWRGKAEFTGRPAEIDIRKKYVGKQVPMKWRTQNPCRYLEPANVHWNPRIGRLEWSN